MKHFFIIFIFFVNTSLLFSSGWEAQNSGAAFSLNDIYFSDPTNGYAAGTGNGLTTFNSGSNWTMFGAPIAGSNCNSTYFTDFITGYFGAAFTGSSIIYKTINGGTAFTLSHLGSDVNYNSIYFPTASIGYAVSENGKILKTTNAGENWVYQVSGTTSKISSVYFVNSSIGFAASQSGIVLFTVNGGGTWNTVFTGVPFNLASICFTNAFTGYAVGQAGTILKTTNAGVNWITQTSTHSHDLYDVDFENALTGYLCGDNGLILRTVNGGTNWIQQPTPSNNNLRSIIFLDVNYGFACGANGTILKTTDGGGEPISVQNISTEIPSGYNLSQNYPNPFNPVTKIQFSLPVSSFVTIKVFSLSGSEIQTLVNENLKAGIYQTDFNAANFPSGTYFYKIQAGEFTSVKKMILLK